MLDELMMKYAEKFGQNFPVFAVKAMPEKEIIALLEQSLESGTPYEADLDPTQALY